MALYRMISTSFWTDSKVIDDFTPEDRYFYLYLFTNPHTTICGCYEISLKQIASETGYALEVVQNLVNRFRDVHKVIGYSRETKEILLLNWYKYNWSDSDRLRRAVAREVNDIKCPKFKEYLEDILNGIDTVSEFTDTLSENSDTVSETTDTLSDKNDTVSGKRKRSISITNTISNTDSDSISTDTVSEKRHKYGQYKNVLLSDTDIEKLKEEFPADWEQRIEELSEGIASKGYVYKNHLATIRSWARKENRDKAKSRGKPNGFNMMSSRVDWDAFGREADGL